MKQVYIDSRLRSLVLAIREKRKPEVWIFSQGRPWLILTPGRLGRLARMLGLEDGRIEDLVNQIRRHCPDPSRYCRPLGLDIEDPSPVEPYPIAICPQCDRVHRPHPMDAGLACAECQDRERVRRRTALSFGELADLARDAAARMAILEKDPGAFMDGRLSPNWRLNYARRLKRDWDAAVNRILMGDNYRRVAREFECSIGLLHRKVREKAYWENN